MKFRLFKNLIMKLVINNTKMFTGYFYMVQFEINKGCLNIL
uniref:Uncharacterized protein n=1 Tax=uncultured Desulfobacterium sp. TaxID=201089 RepID=E1YEJ3_9BACT|nr:unknown protein [uncultured Desulfobacterium sp.]